MRLNGPVLVVAAHPDDEVLGCGGTIAKLAVAGAKVHIMIIGEGITSRRADSGVSVAEEVANLAEASKRAAGVLGAASVRAEGLPDNRLDGLELLDIVKRIEGVFRELRPATVFTQHHGDLNIDHRIVHEATLVACRPNAAHTVRTLFTYEVPSSTEAAPATQQTVFLPNWYVDITATLETKLAALEMYPMELRPWPHTRSLEAVKFLARWRGASCGVEAAEAFQLLRHLPSP